MKRAVSSSASAKRATDNEVKAPSAKGGTSSPGVDASGVVAHLDKSGLYDLQQVKRLLDDQLISFMEAKGYDESTLAANIKLIAGTIAVLAAVYSHFGVKDFAASRTHVLACVVTYILCTIIITTASLFLEASAIFTGALSPLARRVSGRESLPLRVWVQSSIGGRGSSVFRVQIRTVARGGKNVSGGEMAEESYPYERYFTTEGNFLHDAFRSDVETILQRVSTGNRKKSQ